MHTKALLWIAAMAAALLIIAAGFEQYCQQQLALQWEQNLETLPDAELRPLLERAAQQGPGGVRRVAEALACPRTEVVWAAHDVLAGCLAAWQSGASAEVAPLVEPFARTLAAVTSQSEPATRSAAADLALRILRSKLASLPGAGTRITAWCEQVVRAGSPNPAPTSTGADHDAHTEVALVGQPPLLAMAGNRSAPPGGGLPVDVFSPLLPPPGSEIPAPTALAESTIANAPTANTAKELAPQALSIVRDPFRVGAPSAPWARVQASSLGNRSLTSLPHGEKRRLSLAEARASFDREASRTPAQGTTLAEVRELIRQLGQNDADAAAQARAELAQRGFRAADFELARRLSDPSPDARLELARSLPSLTGVDAAPWLLWLADDEDAEVRLTAITLLASCGTPDLLDQAAQLANRDSDPRIRRQAEQIGRLRR